MRVAHDEAVGDAVGEVVAALVALALGDAVGEVVAASVALAVGDAVGEVDVAFVPLAVGEDDAGSEGDAVAESLTDNSDAFVTVVGAAAGVLDGRGDGVSLFVGAGFLDGRGGRVSLFVGAGLLDEVEVDDAAGELVAAGEVPAVVEGLGVALLVDDVD